MNIYRDYIKRWLDFVIALVALVCLSPILLVVTVWLHLANKGAGAFFLQAAERFEFMPEGNEEYQQQDKQQRKHDCDARREGGQELLFCVLFRILFHRPLGARQRRC